MVDFKQMIISESKNLVPSYFGLVMATGIVSLGTFFLEMNWIAYPLFYLNIGFCSILVFLNILKLSYFRNALFADLKSYNKGPGFFTVVAGFSILANQMLLLHSWIFAAKVFFWLAFGIWILLSYTFFYRITTTKQKVSMEKGIDGTWLLIVVGIQAIAVTAGNLIVFSPDSKSFFTFLALSMYMLGCFWYIFIMTLIFLRLTFFPLNPDDLGAPYWINMGATAITTLAGSVILIQAPHGLDISAFFPFLKGFTLFFWVFGSWWIPLLLTLGFWRHFIMKVPAPMLYKGYNPSYWGMVFPLGMYTVCTLKLIEALGFDFLLLIPTFFVYVGIGSWILIALGLFNFVAKKYFHIDWDLLTRKG
ncbi:tellurite resistance/C4-dicarboxylate transporter family protein [Algoriphagus yeomjeoni]|uniref:tellurite resistance/C4-dicarboxylate transporter family protein n=1 Tax=Algoriphagus yeomjeoni TaxID=291403 RepID=UPI003CE47A90